MVDWAQANIERLRPHRLWGTGTTGQLVAKERETVNSMLVVSQRIPFAFLLLLALCIFYFAIVISRQVLAR